MALFVGVVANAAFWVGAALAKRRDWSCSYRYWSDGGRNPNAFVTLGLFYGGILLGVAVAVVGAITYLRTRRSTALISIAIGVAPLVVVVAVILLGHPKAWTYNCSTD